MPQVTSTQVYNKLFQTKIWVIVHHDPYAHGECLDGCCGQEQTTVMGVASSKDEAEEKIKRYQKRVPHDREDFDIDEYELGGEL